MSVRFAVAGFAAALVLAGCGGSGGGGGPDDAVKAYLEALANNDGERACDLLTIDARAELVQDAGTTDCPALVDQFNQFLGGDADRLKDADVSGGSDDGNSTAVTATLDGRNVEVDLEKVDGEWRVDTGGVATLLLGIENESG
jgi:hypothetical protein